MEKEEGSYRAHVIVLPFAGQGHMNPMLQFSKRLAFKGIKITVATTVLTPKTIPAQFGSIKLEPIYDELGESGLRGPGGLEGFFERFETNYLRNLIDLIKKHENSKYPIKCLIYDASLPKAVEITKQLGITSVAFFTQSCAAIVRYLQIAEDYSIEESSILPNATCLGTNSSTLTFVLSQLSDLDQADWIIFNTFDKLEEEAIKNLSKTYRVNAIGPTLPSIYLDKRIEGNGEYGFDFFKPDRDACMKWLSTKQTGSVVYVSFGSVARMREEQMEEIAWGLRQSDCNFLWVVRESEQIKLPCNLIEETSKKGLVVTWCPQLEVLSHQAVGCFVTHCGWNSTIEGVSLGVPMLAMPQYLDQFSDAKFVEEVWKVGLRPKVDEKGIASREEIQECIREILEGVKGEEMKKNAKKWKELAREAVDEGGSSDKHIEDILGPLVCN